MSGCEKGRGLDVLGRLRDNRTALAGSVLGLTLMTGCVAQGNNLNTEQQPNPAATMEIGPDGNRINLSPEKLEEINGSWTRSTVNRVQSLIDIDPNRPYKMDSDGFLIIPGGEGTEMNEALIQVYGSHEIPLIENNAPTLAVIMRKDGEVGDRGVYFANPDANVDGRPGMTQPGDVEEFLSAGDGPKPVVAYKQVKSPEGSAYPIMNTVAIIDQNTRQVVVYRGSDNNILSGDEALADFTDMDSFTSGGDIARAE